MLFNNFGMIFAIVIDQNRKEGVGLMEAFMNFFQNVIVPPLARLGELKHLRAIRNGLAVTIPFIITGSLFLIISSLPIPGWDKIVGGYADKLAVPVNVSFGILAVLATLGIGYNLSKEFEVDPISGALLSLVAFFVTQVTDKYALDTSNFGSTGLFTAIIVSIIAVECMKFFIKRNIVIRLPEGVPPAVANSFISLLPGAVVIILLWVVRVVLGFDITAFLKMVFSPLVFALNTLPGIFVYMLMVCLLWVVGIHGDNVMSAVGAPIFLQYITENSKAFLNHQPIPYITAQGFIDFFVNIGGTGATLALVILMIGSKSKLYNSLGKLALPSGIFEINEPITFGFPIVLNPIMMIPYVVTPMILTTVTYLLMYFNIIGRPVMLLPWTMPPIISHFLITGGDWKAAVWGIISIIISTLVYLPFFKAAERNQLEEERLGTEEA